MNTAAAPIPETDNDFELTPAVDPIQATSDDEPTMVVVTPMRDFCVAKMMYVQPVQEISPSGNDELVL